MNDLPDAPWIGDTERNGMADAPEPVCPCCGMETDLFYLDHADNIIGCANCIIAHDAYDYQQDHDEE